MGGEQLPEMPEGFDAVIDCRVLTDWTIFGPPYLHIPFIDGPAMPPLWYLPVAHAFIMEAISSGKVLVHCAEGHNRSGLVVAYYLIGRDYEPMQPQAAIDLIRSKRPGALTNQTFVDYLLSR